MNISLMDVVRYVHAIDYTALNRFINVTGVEFDSRKIKPGDLFIPLTGGASDGHDYIDQAIKNGAIATLWSKEPEKSPTEQIAAIYVDDTLQAMQDLAKYYRELINPIVVGITGSNGKTTTKDMTAKVLTAKFKVHKTAGNYNNEIGLPYTILQMPMETEVAIIEMGMSGFGEIETLTKIAQPDIACITLIGESHLEHLGNREGIARAKTEILSGLAKDGLLIYPQGERLIKEALKHYAHHSFFTKTIGFDKDADVYAYDLREEKERTYFKSNLSEDVYAMIPVLGAYNVTNALYALTIAETLGVPTEQAIFQLSQFELTANRLEWLTAKNGAQVLNDAYNASPTSMRAVLKSFSALQLDQQARKIVVLGDIRELGPDSRQYHADLSKWINQNDIDYVFLFGQEMQYLYNALLSKYDEDRVVYISESHEELINKLDLFLEPDDYVLMKSSFSVDLLRVVTALRD